MSAVSIGIRIKMPPGHFGLIKECSSSVFKGICVHGGVIDPDYHREIWVIQQNKGKDDPFITKHDLIAQFLVLSCVIGKVEKGEFPTYLAVRGDVGFGSANEIHAVGA